MDARILSLIMIIAVMMTAVFAVDGNNDTNTNWSDTNNLACYGEGKNMPVIPNAKCCEGLKPISIYGTNEGGRHPLLGAVICSNCGNGNCEAWENPDNCETDCKYVPPTPVNCGVRNYSIATECRSDGNNLGYRKIAWTCQNDKSYTEGGETTCKTAETWKRLAEERCQSGCTDSNTIVACTLEYAPVCGQVSVCPTCTVENPSCNTMCTLVTKTFGNKCQANAAGAKILSVGVCNTEKMCGGIAGIKCPEGYTCMLDGRHPDASGVCVKEEDTDICPVYTPPYCPNGTIVGELDERGCKKPICRETPVSDHFRYAKWTCTNGEEFREGSEVNCQPASYWKDLAARKCAALSTRCINPEDDVNDENATIVRCIGGEVGVKEFQTFTPCDSTCKYYADEKGCKIMKCENGETKVSCPTTTCTQPTYEEIKSMKDKCYTHGGQMYVIDDNGCQRYKCNLDANVTTQCITQDQVSQERYDLCSQRGGKLLTKFNEQNCLIYVECVGVEKVDANVKLINKEIITNQGKLLELALKLEGLRMDLAVTADKTKAIADYYTSSGRESDANRFVMATNLLNTAIEKVDNIRKMIRENVSSFTEDKAISVKETIKSINEEILKEVLIAILG
jgi:hypothetical protein